MPMSNAKTTIRLRPVAEGKQTFIEWRMSFDPDEGAEDGLVDAIASIIQAGFDNLQHRFEGHYNIII